VRGAQTGLPPAQHGALSHVPLIGGGQLPAPSQVAGKV